jgi:hypothetical protein
MLSTTTHTCLFLELVLVATSDDHVVHLENHSTQLGSQEQLLTLTNEWVNDKVLPHIC